MSREIIRPVWGTSPIAPSKDVGVQDEDIFTGVEWFDQFATVTNKSELKALSADERFAHAASIRQSVINDLKLADRIDPEHQTIAIVEYAKMAAISTRWARAKELINSKEAKINELASTLEAQTQDLNQAAEVKVSLQSQLDKISNEHAELQNAYATQEQVLTELKLTTANQKAHINTLENDLQSVSAELERNRVLIESVKETLFGELPDASDKMALHDMDATINRT